MAAKGRTPAPDPQLLTEQCSTCVFRPGNLMHLRPGAFKRLVEMNRSRGTALVCHQTLRYGSHPEVGEALCRAYYDKFGDECAAISVFERLGGEFRAVTLPE